MKLFGLLVTVLFVLLNPFVYSGDRDQQAIEAIWDIEDTAVQTVEVEMEPERNHFFTLRCDSTGIDWSVLRSSPFFFIDVYIEDLLNKKELNDPNYSGWPLEGVFTEIFFINTRVYWHKFLGGKIAHDLTHYELTNTTHPSPYPSYYRGVYSWLDFHHGDLHPHSIKIDRTSLEAEFVFHDNPITQEASVRPKYFSYKTECIKANKGEPQKWQKQINTPMDQENERKRAEIIDKRKI
jgi:hypothetical protein